MLYSVEMTAIGLHVRPAGRFPHYLTIYTSIIFSTICKLFITPNIIKFVV